MTKETQPEWHLNKTGKCFQMEAEAAVAVRADIGWRVVQVLAKEESRGLRGRRCWREQMPQYCNVTLPTIQMHFFLNAAIREACINKT